MAMTVMHNLSAMLALRENDKNTNKLSKDLQKVSSGMKLNSAGDGAAGYAISERMRVQIRGLNQDIQNAQTGKSMLRVAEGGVQNIIEELRSLKELAINSANDHNTDLDRATLQKDFDQRRADIDDIVSSTNYNGKILLDGTYARPTNATEVLDLDFVSTIGASDSGVYTITSNGLYQLEAGFTGTINISSGISAVELVGAGSTLSGVYVTSNSQELTLILKDYDVNNSSGDASSIRFDGFGNQLILKGNNSIKSTGSNLPKYVADSAVINMGDGLAISNGEADGSGSLTIGHGGLRGAVIGTDAGQKTIGDITIKGGKITIDMITSGFNGGYSDGAAIGSGSDGGSVGDIDIKGSLISIDRMRLSGVKSGAGIGSGRGGCVEDIDISKSIISITTAGAAGIGSGDVTGGVNTTKAGNITVDNSIITVDTDTGAGIGSGSVIPNDGKNSSMAGNIMVYNSIVNFTTEPYVTGGQTISAEAVGKGVYGEVGSVAVNLGEPNLSTTSNPIVLQVGTKANQTVNCYIDDLSVDSLGISKTRITTRDRAVKALSKVDAAIDYALNQITYIGSYISRLEYTSANLTTASENVTASESTIRDIDMAKGMTDYTKSNVLAQAAQSMLAQANQNSSSVLSLLQ